jgi:hypothetical protein
VHSVAHSRMVVVVPAGPRDDAADTLRSVLRYTEPELVVVIDDTRGRGIGLSHPKVAVISPPATRTGPFGGLFVKLGAAFRHALEHADFDVLLRLDADALLLGPGIAEAAMARFERDPAVGALGSYRVGPDGRPRDWTQARRMVQAEIGLRGLRRPSVRRRLRSLCGAAPGYVPGEHPLGAAVLYRRDAIDQMYRRELLDMPELGDSRLGEDHLFGLLTVAAGYRTEDFGGPDDPLALRWKGLPASPEDLLAAGKLVTHSVRFWQDMREAEIRGYFAARREDSGHAAQPQERGGRRGRDDHDRERRAPQREHRGDENSGRPGPAGETVPLGEG